MAFSQIMARGSLPFFTSLALALTLTLALGAAESARAGCNIIGFAARELPSNDGFVDRPVAGPGQFVTIRADLACNPGKPGFAPPGAANPNQVGLVFGDATLGIPSTTFSVPQALVSVVPESCGALRCEVLRIQIPDTSGVVAGGLTGPAEIRVTRAGIFQPVAVISDLFQPSDACVPNGIAADQVYAPEGTFRRFTVLAGINQLPAPPGPVPTGSFATAVDGSGAALVHLGFANVLQAPAGAPTATILKLSSVSAAILNALDVSSGALSSYNLFGRRIPPLLRLVEQPGGIPGFIGTTDVLESLLRIEPLPEPNPSYVSLMAGGIGPLQLPGGDLTVQSATPLAALRSSLQVVGVGADESTAEVGDRNLDGDQIDLVVEVTNVETGESTDTQKSLTLVRNSGAKPVLQTRDGLVAFLRSEARDGATSFNADGDAMDNRIEVYDATGADRGFVGGDAEEYADPRGRVNGRPLVLTGDGTDDLVYYLSNSSESASRTTERISIFSGLNLDVLGGLEVQGNNASFLSSISADGTQVAYTSLAGNLVSGSGATTANQIFLYEAESGLTTLVTSTDPGIFDESSDSQQSLAPFLSPDGNFVAFESESDNFDPAIGNPYNLNQIMLWDRNDGGKISIVSRSALTPSSGGNGLSSLASVCENGNAVAFSSDASDLIPGDANGATDIFVSRPPSFAPELVSTAFGTGAPAGGSSPKAVISGNCGFVAFTSAASDLLAPGEDTNSGFDVFVADLETGAIERVNVASDGSEASGDASSVHAPSISHDGRYVAFRSEAADLVEGDTNGLADIFVHDREEKTTVRVNVTPEGVQANVASSQPWISGDGRYVAFFSGATNLLPIASGTFSDVFRVDRVTGAIERLNVSSAGAFASAGSLSALPRLSHDGHAVTFTSDASNLSDGLADTGFIQDVFLRRDSDGDSTTTLQVLTVPPGGAASAGAEVGEATQAAVFGGKAVLSSPAPRLAPRVYVVTRGDEGLIEAFDVEGNVGAGSYTIPSNPTVRDIAVSPDGRQIWYAAVSPRVVEALDAETLSSLGTVSLSGFNTIFGVEITPDGTEAWVSDRFFPDEVTSEGSIRRVDTSTRAPIGSFGSDCLEEPRKITMNAANGRAYVLDNGNYPIGSFPGVCVFDIATQTTITRISFDEGQFPAEAVVRPGANALFVSIPSANSVVRIDTATNSVVATINPVVTDEEGGVPRGLALSADGSRLYVARDSCGECSKRAFVIDAATNSNLGPVDFESESGSASTSVRSIVAVPGTELIYASLSLGELAAINGETGDQVHSQQQYFLSDPDFVVAAGEAPTSGTVARYWSQGTGMLTSLGVKAVDAAVSDEVVCLSADTPDNELLVWSIGDFSGPGGTPNVVDSGRQDVEQLAALGSRCISRSKFRSLSIYDSATGTLRPSPFVGAIDFQIDPGSTLIAHRACELENEADFNDDGDDADCVMHAWDVVAEAGLNTQLAAIPCEGFDACETFELYSVKGSLEDGQISFLGREEDQAISPVGCLPGLTTGCDQDGDGRGDGVVVNVVKLGANGVVGRQAFPASEAAKEGYFPGTLVDQSVLTVTSTECSEARKECCTAAASAPICSANPLPDTFAYAPGSCTSRFDTDPDGDASVPTDVAGALDCVTERIWLVPDTDGDGVQNVSSNGSIDNCSAANPDQIDLDGDGLGDAAGCDPDTATVKPGDLSCDLDESGHIDRRDVALIFDAVGKPAVGAPQLGWDRRDRNQSGKITPLDAAICTDACECANCAVGCGGGCGLLGIEALLPVAGLLAARRRRRARLDQAE